MESQHLAEEETKNVFDQLEYTDTKYMLGTVVSMEDTEMNSIEILPSRCSEESGGET